MYIKCKIEYIDDNSQLEVIIKANQGYDSDEEDEQIFFYGYSLEDIEELAKSHAVVESEWRILEILEVMEEL